MSKNKDNKDAQCSFCGRQKSEVRKLVAGPRVYICADCVCLSRDLVENKGPAHIDSKAMKAIHAPSEIKKILDSYVIGQDMAKKILSVAVHNHYKRIAAGEAFKDGVELEKSNILLIGPTGSGKTLLAQTLAKILDVPFSIADATTLTEAGYVGEDVENIIVNLVQAADGDLKKASYGIIYIDEVDKIARRSENPSITRDVSGEGVQQALLKIIEGTLASIPPKGGRKHPQQDFLQIDTSNILFISGGAFTGLTDIISRRLGNHRMGFGAEMNPSDKDKSANDLLPEVQPEDLVKFGMIPEFIGRLPVISTLSELDEDALVQILTEPKNALVKQYCRLFEMDGVTLAFEESALREIARRALDQKTGARGLRAILENIMMSLMYEIPGDTDVTKVTITREMVDAATFDPIPYEMIKKQAIGGS